MPSFYVPQWVAFYEDGSEYRGGGLCNGMHDPTSTRADATPERGLVLIAQERTDVGNAGPEILVGDWFAYHGQRWWNHDLPSLLFELSHNASRFVVVRRGQYVDEPVFRGLMDKARSIVWAE